MNCNVSRHRSASRVLRVAAERVGERLLEEPPLFDGDAQRRRERRSGRVFGPLVFVLSAHAARVARRVTPNGKSGHSRTRIPCQSSAGAARSFAIVSSTREALTWNAARSRGLAVTS